MTYRFGFYPSNSLQSKIDICIQNSQATSSEKPMYTYRDDATHAYADEFIDNVLSKLVAQSSTPKSRESGEKMVGIIHSTLTMLLNQVLGKVTDEESKQSLPFLTELIHSKQGQIATGVVFPEALSIKLKAQFAASIATPNDAAVRKLLVTLMKEQTEAITHAILASYLKTLPLGMIKRKAGDIAVSAITKAANMGIAQLIPSMGETELLTLVRHFDQLLYLQD